MRKKGDACPLSYQFRPKSYQKVFQIRPKGWHMIEEFGEWGRLFFWF